MKLNNPACFLLFLSIFSFFASCLKNQDDTASGPRAKLAIMHLVADAPGLGLVVDGEPLQMDTLAYGTVTQANGSAYLPFVAGGHTMTVTGGSASLLQKTIFLDASKYYSMFFYDSLKNGALKTMVITDDTASIDTVARARFLHFIPGNDTLTAFLAKDTLAISAVRTYQGNQAGTAAPFNIILRPGKYRLQLRKGSTVLYEEPAFSAEAGRLYSFIGRGLRNGTGSRKESLVVVVNK